MIYELFSNIALASFMTALVVMSFGLAIKMYNDKSMVANVILSIAIIFAVNTGISLIIYFWLFIVLGI